MARKRNGRVRRRGAMVVLMAFMLLLFLITVAFSVDVAFMQLTRTELRTATDSAARAGAEALGRLQSVTDARAVAISIAGKNVVAGQALVLEDTDVEFGSSSFNSSDGSWSFDPAGTPVNAVRVTGNRTATSALGSVKLYFGKVLGRETFAPKLHAIAAQMDREIVIVMDRSGSMAWDMSGTEWKYPPYEPADADPFYLPPHATLSRWAYATAAVDVFIEELAATQTHENVGLVSYSQAHNGGGYSTNTADINASLSTNAANVSVAMNQIGSDAIPGATNISAGIDLAAKELTANSTRPLAAKTMIVLTDGHWNRGRDPVEAAKDAAALGITIHTITFSTAADTDTMKDVAREGNGVHYDAPTAETLSDAFRTIARTLPVAVID